MTVFKNAKLILEDAIVADGFVVVENGKIAQVGDASQTPPAQGEIVDCGGLYLSPGFIDLHTHGGGGHDFMDGSTDAIINAAKAHLKYGTTSIVPTTLTSSDEDLLDTITYFKQAKTVTENMPHLLGLHLEGPYFHMEQKGAQDSKYIQNPEKKTYLDLWERAEGTILRWSAAPELDGAMEMGRELSSRGVLMSIAHSNASYQQVEEAFKNGYTHITHLYSGMSTITRKGGFRVLGVVESAYLIDGMTVEIIADGMHLPPELLRLIVKCKNNDEICLVTDSMRGADMPDGESILGGLKGGQTVVLEGGIAKMPDRTCFAGSVATADRLVRVMVQAAGLRLEQAVKMMTLNPAKIIRMDDKKGSISVGKDADLLLFDEAVEIAAVYVNGIKACC